MCCLVILLPTIILQVANGVEIVRLALVLAGKLVRLGHIVGVVTLFVNLVLAELDWLLRRLQLVRCQRPQMRLLVQFAEELVLA